MWGFLGMSELQIYARPHYLKITPLRIHRIVPGLNLVEIVDEVHRRGCVSEAMRNGAVVQLNGDIVPYEQWKNIQPEETDNIVVTVGLRNGGGGGKNPLAMVLSLAVVAAAPMLGAALGAMSGVALAMPEMMVGLGTVFTGIVGGVGLMSVNALFPTRNADLSSAAQSYKDSPTYSASGAQNQARPFSPVPVILGRHKVVPPYGAKPYTELSGNDEYLRMLFVWGHGPLKIEDIKIGDTPITEYDDVDIETREGREDDEPITLITSQVIQDGIGVTLTHEGGWIWRTAKSNADELSIDYAFPNGLVYFNDAGGRDSRTVVLEIAYRLSGTTEVIETFTHSVTDIFVGNLRKGHRWSVARGNYDVGLRRVTEDTSSDRIQDEVMWTNLRTIRCDAPVKAPVPLAMTALRIKASEQLQGVIDNLNAIVTSYAPVWDSETETWGGEEATQNPSALRRLVLTGPGSARPRTASQIDDANLGAFYAFCAAQGYKFNMVRDYQASVWDVGSDICSAARAAPTIIDGKWGTIIDAEDKPVVQHFTPRNSWGFKGEIKFVDAPHAFRVKFVDEDNGYEQDERIVYDDGYDETNATKFESIEFPGITNRDLAWKFGRYHIAQARLRPQTYTFNADFEHLVCQRGDLIRVSHDVPLWGSGSGRVKEILTEDETTVGVVLDEAVVMESGKLYACRFRRGDGSSFLASIVAQVGETDTLSFQAGVPEAQGPQVGDLAMFGEVERETVPLLVKAIRAGADWTAEIECVDYAPEIYEADQGEIPAFDPNITTGTDISKIPPAVPVIVSVESGTAALEKSINGIKARILVSLKQGNGSIRVAQYDVRYKLTGSSDWRYVRQTSDQKVVPLTDVMEGAAYTIQARSISVYGMESDWTDAVAETVVGQKERPANVAGFRANTIGGMAYFSSDPNSEVDYSHNTVRWSPQKNPVPLWGGATTVVERVTSTSFQLPALDGTYLIKAVDCSGNESAAAAAVVVNIANLAGMNFVEKIDQESPSWSGTGDGVVYDEEIEGLRLNGGSEGTYVLGDTVDLQAVFPVRVTAAVHSYGTNLGFDLYSIADIYELADIYGGVTDQTSSGIEIRTTQVNPSGSPVWSAWEPLIIGEYQARAFQPRLRLRGQAPAVTPIVTKATITFDMQDRDEPFNITVPSGGARVAFAKPFFVTPEIGLSMENGQEGDRYTITNKNRTGFDIAVTNGGTPVGGRIASGIARAYGEEAV